MHPEARAIAEHMDPDGHHNFLSIKYKIEKGPLDQQPRNQQPRTPEESPNKQDSWEDPPTRWDNSSNWGPLWNDESHRHSDDKDYPRDRPFTPDPRVAQSETKNIIHATLLTSQAEHEQGTSGKKTSTIERIISRVS